MSMIDCQVSVQKKENPHGDRVLLTFEYVFTSAHSFLTVSDTFQWKIPTFQDLVEWFTDSNYPYEC